MADDILEQKGWRGDAARLADALSNTDATPGGGSAAGAAGAMGCALGEMAAGISEGSKKASEELKSELNEVRTKLRAIRDRLTILTGEDAEAFDAVMAAYRISKDLPERRAKIQMSLMKAGEVPLFTAVAAREAMDVVRVGREIAMGTVAADMNCAEHLLRSAVLCALENVEINVSLIKDEQAAGKLAQAAAKVRESL
jgi:formiminotetrahydrofolate cyclodeaminase